MFDRKTSQTKNIVAIAPVFTSVCDVDGNEFYVDLFFYKDDKGNIYWDGFRDGTHEEIDGSQFDDNEVQAWLEEATWHPSAETATPNEKNLIGLVLNSITMCGPVPAFVAPNEDKSVLDSKDFAEQARFEADVLKLIREGNYAKP